MDQVDVNLDRIRKSLQRRGLLNTTKPPEVGGSTFESPWKSDSVSIQLEPKRPVIMPPLSVPLTDPAEPDAEEWYPVVDKIEEPGPLETPNEYDSPAPDTELSSRPSKDQRFTWRDILLRFFGRLNH